MARNPSCDTNNIVFNMDGRYEPNLFNNNTMAEQPRQQVPVPAPHLALPQMPLQSDPETTQYNHGTLPSGITSYLHNGPYLSNSTIYNGGHHYYQPVNNFEYSGGPSYLHASRDSIDFLRSPESYESESLTRALETTTNDAYFDAESGLDTNLGDQLYPQFPQPQQLLGQPHPSSILPQQTHGQPNQQGYSAMPYYDQQAPEAQHTNNHGNDIHPVDGIRPALELDSTGNSPMSAASRPRVATSREPNSARNNILKANEEIQVFPESPFVRGSADLKDLFSENTPQMHAESTAYQLAQGPQDAALVAASDQSVTSPTSDPLKPPLTKLLFNNRTEAMAGCGYWKPSWKPPTVDDTLPMTDGDRKSIVLRLKVGLNNRINAKDKKGPQFKNRWGGKPFYKENEMEKICWDILDVAERLHTNGPTELSFYDKEFQKKFEKTKAWTFGERIDKVVELVTYYKSRVNTLMKGGVTERYVAIPEDIIKDSETCLRNNVNKAVDIALGRALKATKAATNASAETDSATAASATADAPTATYATQQRRPKKTTKSENGQILEDGQSTDHLTTVWPEKRNATVDAHPREDVQDEQLASTFLYADFAVMDPDMSDVGASTGDSPTRSIFRDLTNGAPMDHSSLGLLLDGIVSQQVVDPDFVDLGPVDSSLLDPASTGIPIDRAMANNSMRNGATTESVATSDPVVYDSNADDFDIPALISANRTALGKRARENEGHTEDGQDPFHVSEPRPIKRLRRYAMTPQNMEPKGV